MAADSLPCIYNPRPQDQLRFDGGLRLDYYQVPNDPEKQAASINDRQREQDVFGTLTLGPHVFARADADHVAVLPLQSRCIRGRPDGCARSRQTIAPRTTRADRSRYRA